MRLNNQTVGYTAEEGSRRVSEGGLERNESEDVIENEYEDVRE
jgi:hypothetical protein